MLAPLQQQLLELVSVELEPAGHQPVAPVGRLDHLGSEGGAQAAHAPLDDLGPGRWSAFWPQCVGEAFCRDRLPVPDREGVEHQTVPRPRLSVGRVDLHRPEEPHSHGLSVGLRARAVNRPDTRLIPLAAPAGTRSADGGTEAGNAGRIHPRGSS